MQRPGMRRNFFGLRARVACLVIALAADRILSVTRGGARMAEAGKREAE